MGRLVAAGYHLQLGFVNYVRGKTSNYSNANRKKELTVSGKTSNNNNIKNNNKPLTGQESLGHSSAPQRVPILARRRQVEIRGNLNSKMLNHKLKYMKKLVEKYLE